MTATRQVTAALEFSNDLSAWIGQHQSTKAVDSRPNRLAAASFSIVLEHRAAALLLLQHDARSSAYALSRAILESYLRGAWAQYCATDADILQAVKIKALPGIEATLRRLDKVEGSDGVFSALKRAAWERLSDFAHGGMQQVVRWIGPDGIAPSHSDEDVIELLGFVDSYGAMASMGVNQLANVSTEAHAQKIIEIRDHYDAIGVRWD